MMDWESLEKHLEYSIKDKEIFMVALSHKSYAKEQKRPDHNEKLEFLGDAILDFVLSDLLMKIYSSDTEGNLSRKRASIVNEERLAEIARLKNFPQLILLGKSEKRNGLDSNSRILSSALEAIVGAIYKDSGFQSCYEWVEKTFSGLLYQAFEQHDFEKDYKTRFQEIIQDRYKETPTYRVVANDGPDHQKTYEIEVVVQETVWASGVGHSKKAAAQNAARAALGHKELQDAAVAPGSEQTVQKENEKEAE